MKKYTALARIRNANFQADFTNIQEFADFCKEQGAKWGHLFDEQNGAAVVSYFEASGRRSLMDRPMITDDERRAIQNARATL